MNRSPRHPITRLSALLAALVLTLFHGYGLARAQVMPAAISVNVDVAYADGTAETLVAAPIAYPSFEDAFWLYLPPQVMGAQSTTLRVDDPQGMYPGGFKFEDGMPVAGASAADLFAMDAGDSLLGINTVFYGLATGGDALEGFRLYVSLSVSMPAPPQEEIQPATVLVKYVDEAGMQIAPSAEEYLEPGTHEVHARPDGLPEGYTLTGPDAQTVVVDAGGANPSIITFTYRAPQPTPKPTEEPVPPAQITVEYWDESDTQIAPSQYQILEQGTHAIYAQPENLPQGYTLISPDVQTVVVDRNGANPSIVTFRYRAPQPTPEPTEEPVQSALITVEYRDESYAQIAPFRQQTLEAGTHDVYAQPEGLPQGYTLVGPDVQTVVVDKYGANPQVVTFIYRAPQITQAPTSEPIPNAQIEVKYLDEGGNTVADPQLLTLAAGVTEVRPQPVDLLPGYKLLGPQSQAVNVDRNGASPAQVVFTYRQETTLSQPVDVPILYMDAQGNRVASATTFRASEGQNPVNPAPNDLMAGYSLLAGEEVKYVSVRDNVATPASLTFYYGLSQSPTNTPPPVPQVALIRIAYRSEKGDLLYSETVPAREGEETVISADLSRVNTAVYAPVEPQSATVTVDGAGRPNVSEVVFLFRDVTVRKAQVRLRYLDETSAILSPDQQVEVATGSTLISASPAALPQGFQLVSENPVTVTLTDSGVLSHAEVVFIYRGETFTPVPATPSPEPTAIPYDVTAMDRYGYPTGDSINFRSAPSASDAANVISQLNRQTLVHVLGAVRNQQSETWYLAEANGREGFLKETVVRLMSYDESAAYFGWTPSPAPLPTPMEDQPRDGEVIDRWAEVADPKGVNFRAQASAASTMISKLKRGERLWVYSQQTVGKDIWYSVMSGGKKGYVRADFMRLMSRAESEQYQSQLASPMPTVQGIAPTPAPVTPAPQEVTQEPVLWTETPPASSYKGYALTTRQAALRTGASQVDEPVLEILDTNSLVYVWGQTFIGAEGWSNVEVMPDGAIGFIPNASLRQIDNQEAKVYLDMLNPQDALTPPPTSLPAQRTGYAIALGENVPLRAFADTNAQIMSLLPDEAVAAVRGQEYTAGAAWHLIQYADMYGFVRADQMRMLTPAQEAAYLQSLLTPTPLPQYTLPPVTVESPSSYGYVNTDRVRLRSGPSTSSQEIKLMGKHAFALVYGSSAQSDGRWYHISQDGSVGYVSASFFTVLPMGELASYLQSPEYLSANSDSIPVTGGYQQPTQITPVEDYNATVWQNPTLLGASYAPFNPLGTPTPPVEAIYTPTPTPSAAPLTASPSLEGFSDPPATPESSFPTGLLAIGLAALLGGGGYYGYYLYKQNQRNAANRAAQRRAQAAGSTGAPQARPAQPTASPYAPPRQGQAPQGTSQYRPGVTPSAQGQVPQGTAQYRPGMASPTQGQVPQGTAQYRPGVTPPAQGQVPQGSTTYRPGVTPPAQFRPSAAPPAQGQASQGAARPGPSAPQAATPPESPTESAASEPRKRRSGRYNGA